MAFTVLRSFMRPPGFVGENTKSNFILKTKDGGNTGNLAETPADFYQTCTAVSGT